MRASILLTGLVTLFFCWQGPSRASEELCLQGKISWIDKGVTKVERSNYCLFPRPGGRWRLFSRNCLVRGGHCLAKRQSGKRIPASKVFLDIGSPAFRLCRLAGGSPQFIRAWTGQRWVKLRRCLFSDNSYVDIDFLFSTHPVAR